MNTIKPFEEPKTKAAMRETHVPLSEIGTGDSFRFAETKEKKALENPGIHIFQKITNRTGADKTDRCTILTLDGKVMREVDSDRLGIIHDVIIQVKESKKVEAREEIPDSTESKL